MEGGHGSYTRPEMPQQSQKGGDVCRGFKGPIEFSEDSVGILLPSHLMSSVYDINSTNTLVDPEAVELLYIGPDVEMDDASIRFLARMFPNLKHLDVRNCSAVTSLEPLLSLPKMEILRLRNCHNITSMEPIRTLSCTTATMLEVKHIPHDLWTAYVR